MPIDCSSETPLPVQDNIQKEEEVEQEFFEYGDYTQAPEPKAT
jgi:hypothetical protein